jgi:hypothetical protein
MKRLTICLYWLACALPALAAPGAHGPNGEHLDVASGAHAAGGVPRVETFTEAFELVGHLSAGELSILVDRYDTNEPVLHGKLEVQYQGMKAQATFHADVGAYAIDDPKLVQALARPGKHQLMFTLVTGDESDLLEGALVVPANAAPSPGNLPRWPLWAGSVGAVLLVLAFFLRRRAVRPIDQTS